MEADNSARTGAGYCRSGGIERVADRQSLRPDLTAGRGDRPLHPYGPEQTAPSAMGAGGRCAVGAGRGVKKASAFFASFLTRCEEDRSNFSEIVENVMQANCKNINKVPLLSLARVY